MKTSAALLIATPLLWILAMNAPLPGDNDSAFLMLLSYVTFAAGSTGDSPGARRPLAKLSRCQLSVSRCTTSRLSRHRRGLASSAPNHL